MYLFPCLLVICLLKIEENAASCPNYPPCGEGKPEGAQSMMSPTGECYVLSSPFQADNTWKMGVKMCEEMQMELGYFSEIDHKMMVEQFSTFGAQDFLTNMWMNGRRDSGSPNEAASYKFYSRADTLMSPAKTLADTYLAETTSFSGLGNGDCLALKKNGNFFAQPDNCSSKKPVICRRSVCVNEETTTITTTTAAIEVDVVNNAAEHISTTTITQETTLQETSTAKLAESSKAEMYSTKTVAASEAAENVPNRFIIESDVGGSKIMMGFTCLVMAVSAACAGVVLIIIIIVKKT